MPRTLPSELLNKILFEAGCDLYGQMPTLRLLSKEIKKLLDNDSKLWSTHLTQEEKEEAQEKGISYKEALIKRTEKLLAVVRLDISPLEKTHLLMAEAKKDLKIAHQLVTHPKLKRCLIEEGFNQGNNFMIADLFKKTNGSFHLISDLGYWYSSITCVFLTDPDFRRSFLLDRHYGSKLLKEFFNSEKNILTLRNEPKLFDFFKQHPIAFEYISFITKDAFLSIFENATYKDMVFQLAELYDDFMQKNHPNPSLKDQSPSNLVFIEIGKRFELSSWCEEAGCNVLPPVEVVDRIIAGLRLKQRNSDENNAQPNALLSP